MRLGASLWQRYALPDKRARELTEQGRSNVPAPLLKLKNIQPHRNAHLGHPSGTPVARR